MDPGDFPAPEGDGIAATVLFIVKDQERARHFYSDVLGGKVVMEKDPVIIKFHNTWIICNTGGGETEDKPGTEMSLPDPNSASVILNLRVADIQKVYDDWSSKGAEFLTPPQDRGAEIRAYMRDPDGHLIEVGQFAGFDRPAPE